MFEQFCQEIKFCTKIYNDEKIQFEEFEKAEIREKHFSLWNDFVSIRVNLIDGKLRQLFENILNVHSDKVNEFYKYFGYYRRLCVMLPINEDFHNIPRLFPYKQRNPWFKMTNRFSKSDNKKEIVDILDLNHIYRFIVLWNGIFSMLHRTCDFNEEQCGLVSKIKDYFVAFSSDNDSKQENEFRRCYMISFFFFWVVLVCTCFLGDRLI